MTSRPQGLVLPRRRRDGRARIPGRDHLAGREKLDNLIFVINCNLQRLDGPVRGNGKIIQELEGVFRGAGWNVIKVIWGYWDPLLARDKDGLLRSDGRSVDGEYQNYKAKGGGLHARALLRQAYPETEGNGRQDMSDEDIWRLNRGGHDPYKVYAAYTRPRRPRGPAHRHPGQDRQGLRHGRGGRRAEHHPPAEEAGSRR
jgi:pyruvate dehydrogenase E1 component